MTINELVTYLGIPPQKVYRAIAARQLTAQKDQLRRYQIAPADLEKFLAQSDPLSCQIACLLSLEPVDDLNMAIPKRV
jgi:excisionase family DNA binding protein